MPHAGSLCSQSRTSGVQEVGRQSVAGLDACLFGRLLRPPQRLNQILNLLSIELRKLDRK
jgi:hypothetical protein